MVQSQGVWGAGTNGKDLIKILIIEISGWIINVKEWMKQFNSAVYLTKAKNNSSKWEIAGMICNFSTQMTHLVKQLWKFPFRHRQVRHVVWTVPAWPIFSIPHHYTTLNRWYKAGWIHAFMMFTPNSDPTIWMLQLKSKLVRPGNVFPATSTCLNALSCSHVIGWLAIYVNTQLNRCTS